MMVPLALRLQPGGRPPTVEVRAARLLDGSYLLLQNDSWWDS